MTVSEVAHTMGCSVHATESLLARARTTLLAAYGDWFQAVDQALPDGTHLYRSLGDPSRFLGHRGLGVSITVRDGVVTGIGSARQFC